MQSNIGTLDQHHNNETLDIILLNYNGNTDTIECVSSILENPPVFKFRIIIVDNKSSNPLLEHLSSYILDHHHGSHETGDYGEALFAIGEIPSLKNIVFIQSEHNGGFAKGNNIGIIYAIHTNIFGSILLLNNDTTVRSDTFSNLASLLCSTPQRTIFGFRVVHFNRDNLIQCDGGAHFSKWTGRATPIHSNMSINTPAPQVSPDYIYGAAILAEKKAFLELGCLDERLFLYYEEPDFCTRATQMNYKLCVLHDVIIKHKGAASTGNSISRSQTPNPFIELHSNRSCIIFFTTHHPAHLPFVLVSRLIQKTIKSILTKSTIPLTSFIRAVLTYFHMK